MHAFEIKQTREFVLSCGSRNGWALDLYSLAWKGDPPIEGKERPRKGKRNTSMQERELRAQVRH